MGFWLHLFVFKWTTAKMQSFLCKLGESFFLCVSCTFLLELYKHKVTIDTFYTSTSQSNTQSTSHWPPINKCICPFNDWSNVTTLESVLKKSAEHTNIAEHRLETFSSMHRQPALVLHIFSVKHAHANTHTHNDTNAVKHSLSSFLA